MLSKTIVAALLATAAVALPAMTARDTVTTPDFILNPVPIDEHNRPGAPADDTANLDKRFYIYHRPPTAAESVEKRDLVPEWLLNPQPIDKPGRPSTPTKRDPNSSVNFWTPEAPADE